MDLRFSTLDFRLTRAAYEDKTCIAIDLFAGSRFLIFKCATTIMLSTPMRYFLSVANTRSLAEASEQMHVTISALSRQIARLEEEVGSKLFDRQPRGMVLNPAGRLLANYVRRTLLEEKQVLDEIHALYTFDRSVIKIAVSEAFARDVVPRTIASFSEQSPGTRFEVSVVAPKEVTMLVGSGKVDLGLTFSVSRDEDIVVLHSRQAPIYALMPRSHALADMARVSLADLHSFPIALPDQDTTIRQIFEMTSILEGLRFDPILTCNNTGMLYVFTQLAGAISLTSLLTVKARLEMDGLIAIPVDHPAMQLRSVQLQSLRGRFLSGALETFSTMLVEELENASGGAVSA